ncbi:MAG: lactate racemase domain-containing protein [Candidatus Brocadiia bacterium]
MAIGKGCEQGRLSEADVRQLAAQALEQTDLDGQRVLVIVPDHTRTAPIPLMFRLLCEQLRPRAERLDFLVALGTHPPMSEERLNALVGIDAEERAGEFADVGLFNHEWDQPEALTTIGTIPADQIEEISGGLMREDVPVQLNKRLFDYDRLLICGPVFPHEVVGFSGGNKYLFPGVAGPGIIHFFHWLGAVITNPVINGTKPTPVRKVVDTAAAMVEVPKHCFAMVVLFDELRGLFFGTPEEAWSAAADLSAKLHIVRTERPFHRVLSVAPPMYDDIWTAGKCMYKLEPVVADGGELVIYAPHVDEISYTHGQVLDQIGYHVRDYFLKQMEKFEGVPRGVMAHSTHVKGIGTFENGVEQPRVNVVLATGIPEERCRRVNLGYRDPGSIDLEAYRDREEEGVLLVPKAGEMLYRLADGTVPRIP